MLEKRDRKKERLMKLECERKLEHVEETCAANLGDPSK